MICRPLPSPAIQGVKSPKFIAASMVEIDDADVVIATVSTFIVLSLAYRLLGREAYCMRVILRTYLSSRSTLSSQEGKG